MVKHTGAKRRTLRIHSPATAGQWKSRMKEQTSRMPRKLRTGWDICGVSAHLFTIIVKDRGSMGERKMKGREKKGKLRATYLTIPSMRILNSRLIEGSVAGLSNAV